VNRIEEIARYINELYQTFEQSGIDFSADCHSYSNSR
jgi:hypothetical protein